MALTDPRERMAHARAVLREKYIDEARASFERLGITPTSDQLTEAGDRLLKQSQRDRMARARADRWTGHAEQKRAADVDWAVTQVHRYADLLHTWDPSTPDSEQTRVCLMAVGDELRSPDGFSRVRLVKRLEALVAHVKEQSQKRGDELTATLREPEPVDLPTLDDIAAELGERPWAGLTAEEMADPANWRTR